jgi:MYXO-CTERM domain-containing protein
MLVAGGRATSAWAGSLYFSEPSDNVGISGSLKITHSVTYEGTIKVSAGTGDGFIFNAYSPSSGLPTGEDLQFMAGPNFLRGYAFPVGYPNDLRTSSVTLSDAFHHIAYVYDRDAGEDRLYLDGQKVASRSVSGPVGSEGGVLFFLGSIFRDGFANPSFQGWLDSLRISDFARYSGDSFAPTIGDLPDDDHTLLLYNFDEAPGSTTINDLSGNGHTGTFDSGFWATPPELVSVPEPSTQALAALGAAVVALVLARRRQANSPTRRESVSAQ